MNIDGPERRAPESLRDAMEPHPEGGRYRMIWESGQSVIPRDGRSSRTAGTAIQYLLDPGEEAAWHRVDSDELWLWQHGGPAQLLTASAPPGTPGHNPAVHLLGPCRTADGDEATAARPWDAMHHIVTAGTWQSTHLLTRTYALFVCVVAPGFDTRDYALWHSDESGGAGRPTVREPAARPGTPSRVSSQARAHRVIDRPADDVWTVVADFAAIASWHPALVHSTAGQDDARLREIVTADGRTIVERLLINDHERRVQEYEFVRHPFAVTDYRARIEVQASGPDRCEAHWSAGFLPLEGDGQAEQAVFENDIFRPGLDALAEQATR